MARSYLDPPIQPRKGRTLRVLGITRISTENQDIKSLDDQKALLKGWVAEHYDGPVDWTIIEGQGSGECLTRDAVADVERFVETEQLDLVVMEDLARHMRRMLAVLLCEQCEDVGTRLIAINDGIDTYKDWRLNACFASMKHEMSNKDTSQRIKRTLRNRFTQGEALTLPIFGYVKPAGAKNDGEVQKDPAAEPIYQEWFRRLDNGASASEVADWLNESHVSTGPYCRLKTWTPQMVARITYNPILKGVRIRNRVTSKRTNKDGKYRAVKADPDELLTRSCPHLAFFEAEYYDRVVGKVHRRNAGYRAGKAEGHHPGKGKPKKRTVWPGQHIYCGICGRMLRYGGHGQNDHLLCRGAYEYRCWNAITVDGPLAAQRISAAVFKAIAELPEFDATLIEQLRREVAERGLESQKRLAALEQRRQCVERSIGNTVEAIGAAGGIPSLIAALQRLEEEREELERERQDLSGSTQAAFEIPSIEDIRERARRECALAIDSPDFARVMRRLIPEIVVYPYRLADGGHIVLRARFTLNLTPLVPGGQLLGCLAECLSRSLTVDFFDPPQREEYRRQVAALLAEGLTAKQAAERLGITSTAAQRAAALDRLLTQEDLSDPYLQVTTPPDDYNRLRRHLHKRYCFEPVAKQISP